MAKSRNRSRDIRKRAAKKRANKERIERRLAEIRKQSTAMLDVAEKLRQNTEGNKVCLSATSSETSK